MQLFAYVGFFAAIVVGSVVGGTAAYQMTYDGAAAFFGAVLGAVGGFAIGVLYAGFVVLLVDIRSQLIRLNAGR